MSEQIFPIDLESVSEYGVEKWRNECFWPVSQQTFLDIERSVDRFVKAAIREHNETLVGDCLRICIKLRGTYTDLLHAVLTLQELRKQGKKVLCHPRSKLFGPLLSGQNTEGLKASLKPRFTVLPSSENEQTTRGLRRLKRKWQKEFEYNRHPKFPGGQYALVAPRLNRLGYEYARRHRAWVHWIDPLHIIARYQTESSNKDRTAIWEVGQHLTDELLGIAQKFGVVLSNQIQNWVRDLTIQALIETAQNLLSAQKYFATYKKTPHLLTSTGAEYFNRVLGHAVRAHGGTITGFAHGTPSGILDTDLEVDLEFSHCHTFGVHSINEGHAYNRSAKKYGAELLLKPINFEAVPSNYYSSRFDAYQKKAIPGHIQTIMLMCAPFVGDSRFNFQHVDLMHLESELRMVECLTNAGYDVIYKQHPDGILRKEAREFIGQRAQIIREPFETVMDEADAYLFYYFGTSTMGPALCTNKPIILIHPEYDLPWQSKPWELFAKRCQIVKAHLDERHRLIFNEEALLQAIAQKPVSPNHEFIEAFFFCNSPETYSS